MQPIGLFGGTFDPIHYGHLRTAFELWQELRLTEVRFMPTGSPPHREQPYAVPELRLAMVKAAVASQPAFVVDDREIRRTGVSYSVDTLTEVRKEFPDRSLCLLRSEEHTSELQSPDHLVCRLLLEKKKKDDTIVRD